MNIYLELGAYDIKTNETHMENYKNFFADSYVDEVFMEDNNVILIQKVCGHFGI